MVRIPPAAEHNKAADIKFPLIQKGRRNMSEGREGRRIVLPYPPLSYTLSIYEHYMHQGSQAIQSD
jgi:hypothetical protein